MPRRPVAAAGLFCHDFAEVRNTDTILLQRRVLGPGPDAIQNPFVLYFPPTSEQLAARTLSKDLVTGWGENVLIALRNGGVGPTSRGHAAAPNKRLRRLLSKWVPIGAYRTLIRETEYRMCYGVYICRVIRAKLGGRNYSHWYLKKTAFGT
jgi:hypothetical protein